MKFLTKLTSDTGDSLLSKLVLFKAFFVLASEEYSNVFEVYIKTLNEEISYAECEILRKFYDDYHFNCRFKLSAEGLTELRNKRRNPYEMELKEYIDFFGSVDDYNKYAHAAGKLMSLGRQEYLNPYRKEYKGITRSIMDQPFILQATREEAEGLFLIDYLDKKKRRRCAYVDLTVNILEPIDTLVEAFTSFVKNRTSDVFKNILKQDGRFNTPDFDMWELYLVAYLLRVKQVRADIFDSNWPERKVNRQEAANLLFNGSEYNDVQRLDRYVRNARALSKKAINNEEIFNFDL